MWLLEAHQKAPRPSGLARPAGKPRASRGRTIRASSRLRPYVSRAQAQPLRAVVRRGCATFFLVEPCYFLFPLPPRRDAITLLYCSTVPALFFFE